MKTWPLSNRTRILIVDDEVGFTRLFKLAARQYEIRAENNPLKAVEAAMEFRPDIILLDRFMPKMSGEALVKSFQAHPKLEHIRIAFLSATVPRDAAGRFCTHLDGHRILAKPISVDQIDQFVREYANR
jgi:CheY-like chemotaxis protein